MTHSNSILKSLSPTLLRPTLLKSALLVSALLVLGTSTTQAQTLECDTQSETPCSISIGGGAWVRISAPGSQFEAAVDGTGFEIHGNIHLGNSENEEFYMLYDTRLIAEYANPSRPEDGFRRLHGSALMQAQVGKKMGMFDLGAEKFIRVDVGLELGSILQDELGILHLNPQRDCNGFSYDQPQWRECPYWIFRKIDEQSLNGKMGGTDIGLNISADTSSSNNVSFLMDPEDFFMYVGFTQGSMDSVTLNISPSGEDNPNPEAVGNNDRGLGFSQKGLIPFYPATSYGIAPEIETLGLNFEGHLVVDWADIPLGGFAKMDGSFVYKFPVDQLTGEAKYDGHFQGAGNGNIFMSVPMFSSVINWEMALGSATAGVTLSENKQLIFISGDIDKDFPWKPEALPLYLDYKNNYKVAAVIVNNIDPSTSASSIDLSDSFIQMEGEYLMDFGFGDTNSSLSSAARAEGFMRADFDNGIEFFGLLGDGVSATAIHPLLSASREVSIYALMNPNDSSADMIELTGSFSLGGDSYQQDGVLRITKNDTYLGFPASFDFNKLLDAYNSIQNATRTAEADVERLSLVITQQRSIVQAERDAHLAAFTQAQNDLNSAQTQVNLINASIATNYKNISYYKGRISSYYRWYKSQVWYKKASAYTTYLAKKAYYSSLIAAQYSAIGAKKVALAAATVALDIAKGTLAATQTVVDASPIDLDPRIAPILVSYEAAMASLNAIQNAMPEIPEIPGTITATIGYTLNGAGLTPETRAQYCDNGQCIDIKGGTYDGKKGLACIDLPTLDNQRVCTAVPKEPI